MSNTTTVTFKTPKDTKKEAQAFFASLGMNLSTAINLLLKDAVMNRKFSVTFEDVEPYGTLYPMAYDDLTKEQKKAYHEVDALNEDDFITYSRKDYVHG